jgi:hypothetical protein
MNSIKAELTTTEYEQNQGDGSVDSYMTRDGFADMPKNIIKDA